MQVIVSFTVCLGLLSGNLLSLCISQLGTHYVIITKLFKIQYTCTKCKTRRAWPYEKRKHANMAVAAVVAFLYGYARH